MSRLTLMVARSKSFITATPSYCSWSRSCETKTQRAQTKYVAGQATTRRANEAEKGNATWYSNCNVSKWTPMNLAFTSNTPTVSDGEISKMAFLNLRWEKSRRRLFKAEERQTSNLGLFLRDQLHNSLVGLQVLYGDQHALFVQAGGCVFLRNLFALLSLVVAWFLWQPEKKDTQVYNKSSSQHRLQGSLLYSRLWHADFKNTEANAARSPCSRRRIASRQRAFKWRKRTKIYAVCNNSNFITFTEFNQPKDEQKDSFVI